MELLTAPEVAKMLRISLSSAYRLLGSNEFTVIRVGRSIRCDKEVLLEWIKRKE